MVIRFSPGTRRRAREFARRGQISSSLARRILGPTPSKKVEGRRLKRDIRLQLTKDKFKLLKDAKSKQVSKFGGLSIADRLARQKAFRKDAGQILGSFKQQSLLINAANLKKLKEGKFGIVTRQAIETARRNLVRDVFRTEGAKVAARIKAEMSKKPSTIQTIQEARIKGVLNIIGKKKVIDASVSKKLKRFGLTDKNIENVSELAVRNLPISILERKLGRRLDFKSPLIKVRKELALGAIKEIRDKPTTAAISIAIGASLPSTIKFLGGTKVIKKISGITPSKIKIIGKKIINPALISAYVAGSGLEIVTDPRGKPVERIGGKLSTEVIPFQVGSSLGVRGLLRSELKAEINKIINKLPKSKKDAFKELMTKSDVLGKTKTTVRDVDLKRLKRIPDNAKPEIIRFLKKNDIIVGGSLGQQTGVRVKRTLAQSDLDLYTEKDPVGAAKKLASSLKGQGIKRVSQIRGQVTIGGKKAAEFHDLNRLLANIESVIPFWKGPRSFIIRTPSGIRVPRISIQLKRKLIGGFTDPKRAKDLKDARDILNQLFKRAELKARSKWFFSKKNIKALEKAFGAKLTRKILKIPKIKKIKPPTERFKKPRKIKRVPSPRGKKVGVRRVISKRKLKVRKISKVKKPKRIKPSQRRKRIKKVIRPSQRIRKVKRKPSQVPVKKPKRKVVGRPSQPPRKPPRKVPPLRPPRGRPSQPPIRPPRRGPPIKPPKGPPGKPPIKPPRKPPIPPALPPRIKRRIKPRRGVGYFIQERRAGKFVRLKGAALSKKDALDRLAFRLDNKISRTARLIKAKKIKKLGELRKREVGYFQRTKKNLRNFRIVKGRKVRTPNQYIERKGKAVISTRGEKERLRLNRIAKARRRIGRRRTGIPKSTRRKTISRPSRKTMRTPTRRKIISRSSRKVTRVRIPARASRTIKSQSRKRINIPSLKRDSKGRFLPSKTKSRGKRR